MSFFQKKIGSLLLLTAHLTMTGDEALNWTAAYTPALKHIWPESRTKVENARIELGRLLYFDKRLSRDDSVSCNSCHDTLRYGVDGLRFSKGIDEHLTPRHSPSTFNAFLYSSQFWDTRAETVEEQAKGPILAKGEMGMPSEDAVVKKLMSIDGYESLFKQAFPNDTPALTFDNLANAIGAYERVLISPGRFDQFVNGDVNALTTEEKKGFITFNTVGCMTCHYENALGGLNSQKLGLIEPWPNQKDQGRFESTGQEHDRMVFKVCSLRNVAETAPYFHDGSVETLKEAIRLMAKHQLGIELKENEVNEIETFLKCLTGTVHHEAVKPPSSFPGMEAE